MRRIQVFLGALLFTGSMLLASCGRGPVNQAAPPTAVVSRGNLQVSITSTGNLALSQSDDLAFEMAGVVQEVLVETGQTVTTGQKLANLDTSEWEAELTKLERDVVNQERALAKAERQIAAKELSVRQAELDLRSAENNISQTAALKDAQDAVEYAEFLVKFAKMVDAGIAGVGVTDPAYWSEATASFNTNLAEAKAKLDALLKGGNTSLSADAALQIARSQLQLEQAKRQVEESKIAIEDARLARDDASQALDDAESALEKARVLSPIITAPFDGFITKVNVKGGDEVKKGTVALQLADPDKFEVSVLVGQSNISSISLGTAATVKIDALSGVTVPARVTAIAPTATVQSGVVNYPVTIELATATSSNQTPGGLFPSFSGNQTGRQGALSNNSTRFPPFSSNQTGRQRPQSSNSTQSSGASNNQTWQSRLPQDMVSSQSSVQLKQGMSVTVSIITAQSNDTLMVPNRAITREQGTAYVTVLKDGASEKRAVKTGISNSQYTAITEGLAEGETVVIAQATSTAPASQQNRQPSFFGQEGMIVR